MKITFVIGLSVLLLSACHTSRTALPASADQSIVNKYWKLIALDGRPITTAENQEREAYITLRADSTLTGHTGCNGLGGHYTLQPGNRIRFRDMLSTMRYCDAVPWESVFTKALNEADNYTVHNDTLSLQDSRRAPLARFVAVYLK